MPLTTNGVSTPTYNASPNPIVIGAYAPAVQAKVNGALTQKNEEGATIISGGQNGFRLTSAVDIWQTQAIIDAYEFVKNAVALPAADVAPTIPLTKQPAPLA